MTSLRILKLSIDFHMDIFDGCTFKLDSFDCINCFGLNKYCESFSKFLSGQPSLKYMSLPQYFEPTMPSSLETCLPNLTRINARFEWLPYLIPGRPLNEVYSPGYIPFGHSKDLSFFALSTTPIQKLMIDYSYLYPTPGHFFASFLPSLTYFTLSFRHHFHSLENIGVCGLPLYNYWILRNAA
jgi:hypothetical protein